MLKMWHFRQRSEGVKCPQEGRPWEPTVWEGAIAPRQIILNEITEKTKEVIDSSSPFILMNGEAIVGRGLLRYARNYKPI